MDETSPASAAISQLTVRAIASGMFFGALLSLCNIYTGLKIGWGTNMSITAALLSFGFWKVGQALGARKYDILENNINQTAASAGATISSAGLVAPIPALAMITGQTLSWPLLSLWVFSVAALGVVVALGIRKQMLEVDNLPFPFGIATASTLREMYASGGEAVARVTALIIGGVLSGGLKVAQDVWKLPKISLPAISSMKVGAASLKNLGFSLDPGLLMIGVGAMIGMRAAASMFVGAVVSWGIVGPMVLDAGWATPGAAEPEAVWFGPMVKWFLWPGVAMMVTSSLTSVAFSWRSLLKAVRNLRAKPGDDPEGVDPVSSKSELPSSWFLWGLLSLGALSVVCQVLLFDIHWLAAVLAVLITFVLAVVAARVAGETGLTPIGAMGKVTQLTFGLVAPASATTNLMAANVTGGAASQCADLLHDLRAGKILGSWPRHQAVAQLFGVAAGALAGSAAYLVLIPDPKTQLLTKEWPAPAVAQWKAVAELFSEGLSAMPAGSTIAIAVCGTLGIGLAVLEKTLPEHARKYVPSPGALGLAAIVPAYISIAMFLGGLSALLLQRFTKSWALRFTIPIAAGFVAGESLSGVGIALGKMMGD